MCLFRVGHDALHWFHSLVMASVEEFIAYPTERFLDVCSRDQLVKLAKHYGVEVDDKCQKIDCGPF